jgi:hypothetical protein
MSQYLAEYYTAGGGGLPNIHVYPKISEKPADQATSEMISTVQAVRASLPPSLQEHFVLGETGLPRRPCIGGVDSETRKRLYTSILQSLAAGTQILDFWRLFDLKPTSSLPADNCENYFGVLPASPPSRKGE